MNPLVVLLAWSSVVANKPSSANVTVSFDPPLKLVSPLEPHAATFGVFPANVPIKGRLIYLPGPQTSHACRAMDTSTIAGWPYDEPVILIVDRGRCPWVMQVRRAQDVGAVAVIFADNGWCKQYEACDIYAAGYSADITIPSILVNHEDGQVMKKAICGKSKLKVKQPCTEKSRTVHAILQLRPNPRAHKVVKWEFWTAVDDLYAKKFKAQLQNIVPLLGPAFQFQPHYLLHDGKHEGCFENQNPESTVGSHCSRACTNAGRYCADDPDGDTFYGLNGGDIVRETLRQLCVHQVASAAGQPHKWWQYVTMAGKRCGDFRVLPAAEECTHAMVRHDLLRMVGLDVQKVMECEQKSG